MLYRLVAALKRFVQNPYLNMAVGLAFLYSGIAEAVSDYEQDEQVKIGVHHGVIIFATLQILKVIPDIYEGIEKIEKAGKEEIK